MILLLFDLNTIHVVCFGTKSNHDSECLQKYSLSESDKVTFLCSIPKITMCFCTMNKISFEANQTGEEELDNSPIFGTMQVNNKHKKNYCTTAHVLSTTCLPISWMDLRMEDCCSKFQKRSTFRKTEIASFTIICAFRLNLFCRD